MSVNKSDKRPADILLISDPRVLAIPIQENHEPLVDLREESPPLLLYGPSPEVPDNQDYTKMRRSVYEKLLQAQQKLPQGLRFCLYEAYRSLHLQRFLFETRWQRLYTAYPHWTEAELFTETTRLVAPVVNQDKSVNIPPHSTGGAVDLYLIDEAGHTVDMGIHPQDWMQDEKGELSQTWSRDISREAQANRALMSAVLQDVGFINYPTEYWHWSYGDRYWAYHTRAPHTLYSALEGINPLGE